MISKDLEYMKRLEENVFPYLIMSAKDIREIGDEDRTREALVRMRIADYLVELGIFYYSQVEHAFDALLTKDSKEAAEADYIGPVSKDKASCLYRKHPEPFGNCVGIKKFSFRRYSIGVLSCLLSNKNSS